MKIESPYKRLFISRTRFKLIQIFFYHPREFYYVRQLVRLTGEEINSVRRELQNLKLAGVICSENRANKLYYWANPISPLFLDLLTFANKTVGLGLAAASRSNRPSGLKMLLYSYQFASDNSDPDNVDLIMIGDLSPKDTESLIRDEQERRGREINYMLMPKSEYSLRRQKRDPFIVDFFLNRPLLIIGTPKDLLSS